MSEDNYKDKTNESAAAGSVAAGSDQPKKSSIANSTGNLDPDKRVSFTGVNNVLDFSNKLVTNMLGQASDALATTVYAKQFDKVDDTDESERKKEAKKKKEDE